MIDNCIENYAKPYNGQPMVLIVDPGGQLKLVKWRLKSDGFGVLYTDNIASVKALTIQNNVQIVIVNVLIYRDLKNVIAVNGIKGNFVLIAFTGNNAGLKKQMFDLGVRRTFSKPIDFPKLSLMVRDELKKTGRDRVTQSMKKHDTASLGLSRAYRIVLDHIKTAVMITDCRGIIVCVNRSMALLLQMNEDDILDNHYQNIMNELSGTYQYKLLRVLQQSVETLEVHGTTDIMISNGNQTLFPVEADAHPIFDKRDNFIGTFLTVGGILGSETFKRVAAQSEKLAMVGQIAAGVVHEIKNPLTSVRGFIQLLQREAPGTSKAEHYNIIIDEIDRVNNIVNDFLKLARPAHLDIRPFDLRELWEDIRLLMESEAFLLNINIKEELSENIKPVLIDCEQIKQVLINVVINSFEAMANGGDLTVRLTENERDKEVCLEISDTGMGMDEETVRRIFIPFFTTKDNGTGLGLAVSATIIENHGGRIEVKSKIGQGTTTMIYFSYE